MRRSSSALPSTSRSPSTRFTPAPATNCASSAIGASAPPFTKRGESPGSPSPRSTRSPRTTPSLSMAPCRSTSVEKACCAPRRSSASAAVNVFMVDAGTNARSALVAKSVSPWVSETTIAPQSPLRVPSPISAPRSAASAVAPRGVVNRSSGSTGATTRFAVVRRAAGFRADVVRRAVVRGGVPRVALCCSRTAPGRCGADSPDAGVDHSTAMTQQIAARARAADRRMKSRGERGGTPTCTESRSTRSRDEHLTPSPRSLADARWPG
jgi:hypothetical protein